MTDSETPSRDFLLGVVEGFYGRPFTSEQRKELFRKIKNFGMQCYVYAPKDDYKHRGYWRELYTVEEGDHLAGKNLQRTWLLLLLSDPLNFFHSSRIDNCSKRAKHRFLLCFVTWIRYHI